MGWSQIFLNVEFAKNGKLTGESEFEGFEGQIVLLDFDWSLGVNQDVPQKNADPIRKPAFAPLSLTKRFDASSIKLMSCLQSRDPIVKARITVAHRVNDTEGTLRQAFAIEVEKARLESVTLNMNSMGNSIILQEDISIRYSKIKVEQYAIGADGRYKSTAKIYRSQFQDAIDLNET